MHSDLDKVIEKAKRRLLNTEKPHDLFDETKSFAQYFNTIAEENAHRLNPSLPLPAEEMLNGLGQKFLSSSEILTERDSKLLAGVVPGFTSRPTIEHYLSLFESDESEDSELSIIYYQLQEKSIVNKLLTRKGVTKVMTQVYSPGEDAYNDVRASILMPNEIFQRASRLQTYNKNLYVRSVAHPDSFHPKVGYKRSGGEAIAWISSQNITATLGRRNSIETLALFSTRYEEEKSVVLQLKTLIDTLYDNAGKLNFYDPESRKVLYDLYQQKIEGILRAHSGEQNASTLAPKPNQPYVYMNEDLYKKSKGITDSTSQQYVYLNEDIHRRMAEIIKKVSGDPDSRLVMSFGWLRDSLSSDRNPVTTSLLELINTSPERLQMVSGHRDVDSLMEYLLLHPESKLTPVVEKLLKSGSLTAIPTGFYHDKSFAVFTNGELSAYGVGSANISMRAYEKNIEASIIIEDREILRRKDERDHISDYYKTLPKLGGGTSFDKHADSKGVLELYKAFKDIHIPGVKLSVSPRVRIDKGDRKLEDRVVGITVQISNEIESLSIDLSVTKEGYVVDAGSNKIISDAIFINRGKKTLTIGDRKLEPKEQVHLTSQQVARGMIETIAQTMSIEPDKGSVLRTFQRLKNDDITLSALSRVLGEGEYLHRSLVGKGVEFIQQRARELVEKIVGNKPERRPEITDVFADLLTIKEGQMAQPLTTYALQKLEHLLYTKTEDYADLVKEMILATKKGRRWYKRETQGIGKRVYREVLSPMLAAHETNYIGGQLEARTPVFGTTKDIFLLGGVRFDHSTPIFIEGKSFFRGISSVAFSRGRHVSGIEGLELRLGTYEEDESHMAVIYNAEKLFSSMPGLKKGNIEEVREVLKEIGREDKAEEIEAKLSSEWFLLPIGKSAQLSQRMKNWIGSRPMIELDPSFIESLRRQQTSDPSNYLKFDVSPVLSSTQFKDITDTSRTLEDIVREPDTFKIRRGYLNQLRKIAIVTGATQIGDFAYTNRRFFESHQFGYIHKSTIGVSATSVQNILETQADIKEKLRVGTLIFSTEQCLTHSPTLDIIREEYRQEKSLYQLKRKYDFITRIKVDNGEITEVYLERGLYQERDGQLTRVATYDQHGRVILGTKLSNNRVENLSFSLPGFSKRDQGGIGIVLEEPVFQNRGVLYKAHPKILVTHDITSGMRIAGTVKAPMYMIDSNLFDLIKSESALISPELQKDEYFGIFSVSHHKGYNYESGLHALADSKSREEIMSLSSREMIIYLALAGANLKKQEHRQALAQLLTEEYGTNIDSSGKALIGAIKIGAIEGKLFDRENIINQALPLLRLGDSTQNIKENLHRALLDPTYREEFASKLRSIIADVDKASFSRDGKTFIDEGSYYSRAAGLLTDVLNIGRQTVYSTSLKGQDKHLTEIPFVKNGRGNIQDFIYSPEIRLAMMDFANRLGIKSLLVKDVTKLSEEEKKKIESELLFIHNYLQSAKYITRVISTSPSASLVAAGMKDEVALEFHYLAGMSKNRLRQFDTDGKLSEAQAAVLTLSRLVNPFPLEDVEDSPFKIVRMVSPVFKDPTLSKVNEIVTSYDNLNLRFTTTDDLVGDALNKEGMDRLRRVSLGIRQSQLSGRIHPSLIEEGLVYFQNPEDIAKRLASEKGDVLYRINQFDRLVQEAIKLVASPVSGHIKYTEEQITKRLKSYNRSVERIIENSKDTGAMIRAMDMINSPLVKESKLIVLPEVEFVEEGDRYRMFLPERSLNIGILLGTDVLKHFSLLYPGFKAKAYETQEQLRILYPTIEKIMTRLTTGDTLVSHEEMRLVHEYQTLLDSSYEETLALLTTKTPQKALGERTSRKGASAIAMASYGISPTEAVAGTAYGRRLTSFSSSDPIDFRYPAVPTLPDLYTPIKPDQSKRIKAFHRNLKTENISKIINATSLYHRLDSSKSPMYEAVVRALAYTEFLDELIEFFPKPELPSILRPLLEPKPLTFVDKRLQVLEPKPFTFVDKRLQVLDLQTQQYTLDLSFIPKRTEPLRNIRSEAKATYISKLRLFSTPIERNTYSIYIDGKPLLMLGGRDLVELERAFVERRVGTQVNKTLMPETRYVELVNTKLKPVDMKKAKRSVPAPKPVPVILKGIEGRLNTLFLLTTEIKVKLNSALLEGKVEEAVRIPQLKGKNILEINYIVPNETPSTTIVNPQLGTSFTLGFTGPSNTGKTPSTTIVNPQLGTSFTLGFTGLSNTGKTPSTTIVSSKSVTLFTGDYTKAFTPGETPSTTTVSFTSVTPFTGGSTKLSNTSETPTTEVSSKLVPQSVVEPVKTSNLSETSITETRTSSEGGATHRIVRKEALEIMARFLEGYKLSQEKRRELLEKHNSWQQKNSPDDINTEVESQVNFRTPVILPSLLSITESRPSPYKTLFPEGTLSKPKVDVFEERIKIRATMEFNELVKYQSALRSMVSTDIARIRTVEKAIKRVKYNKELSEEERRARLSVLKEELSQRREIIEALQGTRDPEDLMEINKTRYEQYRELAKHVSKELSILATLGEFESAQRENLIRQAMYKFAVEEEESPNPPRPISNYLINYDYELNEEDLALARLTGEASIPAHGKIQSHLARLQYTTVDDNITLPNINKPFEGSENIHVIDSEILEGIRRKYGIDPTETLALINRAGGPFYASPHVDQTHVLITAEKLKRRMEERSSFLTPDLDRSSTLALLPATGAFFTQGADFDGDSYQFLVENTRVMEELVIALQKERRSTKNIDRLSRLIEREKSKGRRKALEERMEKAIKDREDASGVIKGIESLLKNYRKRGNTLTEKLSDQRLWVANYKGIPIEMLKPFTDVEVQAMNIQQRGVYEQPENSVILRLRERYHEISKQLGTTSTSEVLKHLESTKRAEDLDLIELLKTAEVDNSEDFDAYIAEVAQFKAHSESLNKLYRNAAGTALSKGTFETFQAILGTSGTSLIGEGYNALTPLAYQAMMAQGLSKVIETHRGQLIEKLKKDGDPVSKSLVDKLNVKRGEYLRDKAGAIQGLIGTLQQALRDSLKPKESQGSADIITEIEKTQVYRDLFSISSAEDMTVAQAFATETNKDKRAEILKQFIRVQGPTIDINGRSSSITTFGAMFMLADYVQASDNTALRNLIGIDASGAQRQSTDTHYKILTDKWLSLMKEGTQDINRLIATTVRDMLVNSWAQYTIDSMSDPKKEYEAYTKMWPEISKKFSSEDRAKIDQLFSLGDSPDVEVMKKRIKDFLTIRNSNYITVEDIMSLRDFVQTAERIKYSDRSSHEAYEVIKESDQALLALATTISRGKIPSGELQAKLFTNALAAIDQHYNTKDNDAFAMSLGLNIFGLEEEEEKTLMKALVSLDDKTGTSLLRKALETNSGMLQYMEWAKSLRSNEINSEQLHENIRRLNELNSLSADERIELIREAGRQRIAERDKSTEDIANIKKQTAKLIVDTEDSMSAGVKSHSLASLFVGPAIFALLSAGVRPDERSMMFTSDLLQGYAMLHAGSNEESRIVNDYLMGTRLQQHIRSEDSIGLGLAKSAMTETFFRSVGNIRNLMEEMMLPKVAGDAVGGGILGAAGELLGAVATLSLSRTISKMKAAEDVEIPDFVSRIATDWYDAWEEFTAYDEDTGEMLSYEEEEADYATVASTHVDFNPEISSDMDFEYP